MKPQAEAEEFRETLGQKTKMNKKNMSQFGKRTYQQITYFCLRVLKKRH